MTMTTTRRTFCLSMGASFCALLAGCAGLPKDAGVTELTGRFSLQINRNSKSDSVSGKYRLTRSQTVTRLDLLSPLNGVIARIVIDEAGATLERGGDEAMRAKSAHELMQENLGFSVPVEMLFSWLEGRPWEGESSVTLTENSFDQAAWTVTTVRRDAAKRPAVLRLNHAEDEMTPALRISMTVDRQM